jgi:hypothetical protein
MTEENISKKQDSTILGVDASQLAGVTVDELVKNPTAIKMLMHYYRQILAENSSLKNENNTLQTYVSGYERKKTRATVGAILLVLANIFIGFGTDLLSSETSWPGISAFILGLALSFAGLYLSLKD